MKLLDLLDVICTAFPDQLVTIHPIRDVNTSVCLGARIRINSIGGTPKVMHREIWREELTRELIHATVLVAELKKEWERT